MQIYTRKMGTIIATNMNKNVTKQGTLLKREKICMIFIWDIFIIDPRAQIVVPLSPKYSLRSMAVLSSRAQERRGHEKFAREARENERRSREKNKKLFPLQSPRGFSALARLYYLVRPTKTAMLRRLPKYNVTCMEPITRSEPLPCWAYVTAFLPTSLFLNAI